MPLTNVDDIELRNMAKKVNQRLRNLEKYEADSGVGQSPAQRLADYYLEDFGGRKRFPENIDKLGEEAKDFLRGALSNFLAEETSTVRGWKQAVALYEVVNPELDIDTSRQGEPFNPFLDEEDEKRKQFFDLYDQARNAGLAKLFDYKTLKHAIGWAVRQAGGDKAIISKIAEDINKLANKKDLTRRKLIDTITRSRRAPKASKPGKVKPDKELKAEPNERAPQPKKHMPAKPRKKRR